MAENETLKIKLSQNSTVHKTTQTDVVRTAPHVRCFLCKIWIQGNEYSKHLCVNEESIDCHYCTSSFASIHDLMNHIVLQHSMETKTKSNVYKCDYCSAVYASPILLKCHKKSHKRGEAMIILEKRLAHWEKVIAIHNNNCTYWQKIKNKLFVKLQIKLNFIL